MAKYRVMIGRPCTQGQIHQSVANFCSSAWKYRFTDPWCKKHISELIEVPVDRFPTDCARNLLAQTAIENEVDYLFMIDSDADAPFDFFTDALMWLTMQAKPCAIGLPYVDASGEVPVFDYLYHLSSDPGQPKLAITKVPRSDALQRKGKQFVASIGTHSVCIDTRVFAECSKPYFRYGYNFDHTQVTETEDTYFFRQMLERDLPIWCDWDRWSAHFKTQRLLPLDRMQPSDIPEWWRTKAKEYYLYDEQGRQELQESKNLK